MRKLLFVGIIWGLVAWIPYYTNHLAFVRSVVGIPAAIGLNLELALGFGDAFIYSIIFSSLAGLLLGSAGQIVFTRGLKVIGLGRRKKKTRRNLH
jgi:hypothetical protein